jgi:PAS domain S-box-containing protein
VIASVFMVGLSSPQGTGAWRFRIAYAAVFVVVVVVAAVLLSELPVAGRRAVSGLGLVGGALAVAASCIYKVRRSSGRRRISFGSLCMAALLAAAGNAQLTYLNLFLNTPGPGGDAFLTLALCFAVVAVAVYPSTPRRGTDLARMVLDGVVIGGSILFTASIVVFPYVLSNAGAGVVAMLPLLPPVVDVVAATVAALLFLRGNRNDRSFLALVSLGFASYAVSDFVYAALNARGAYGLGTIADLGWIVGYALLALALIRANAPSGQGETLRETSPVVGTVLMFSLFIVAAIVSLSTGEVRRLDTPAGVIWLGVLIAVAARQIFLIVDNEKLRQILEERVIERSSQLRQVTQQSDLLVNSVGDGIYGVDQSGAITFVNPAAAAVLRYDQADLIGKHAHDTFHAMRPDGTPYPADACYITEAISHRIATSAEDDVYTRADGVDFAVEVTATPLTEDDQVRGAVVVFRDVTQRREMDRLKSEFVSMVSHELRTPLTAIRGSLGLLVGGAIGGLDGRAGRMIKIALDSTERLTRLINDILDVERIEAGVMPISRSVHPARDLIQAALAQVHVLAQQADVSILVGETPGEVYADADWVQQTLLNLLSNAIKFSPPGSVVDVHTAEVGANVEFTIRDRGRGVPDDKLDSIFTRFQQVDSSDAREKGGTGLGLAISRSLIERLGGRIWAENNATGGASFRFTLPRPTPALLGSAGIAHQKDAPTTSPGLNGEVKAVPAPRRSSSTKAG